MLRSIVFIALWLSYLCGQSAAPTARDLYYASDSAEGIGDRRQTSKDPSRLGLRFNLLKVDPSTGNTVEVDPDFHFRADDCFAIRLRPNRPGYIYVFNQGSSGSWQTLLPSTLAPEVSNSVKAGEVVLLPSDYCFIVRDPPGIEQMLIAFTETQQELYRLNEAMRKAFESEGNSPAALAGPQKMASRDLSFMKIARPLSTNEPPNSVYFVNSSAASENRVIIRATIHHE